MANGKRAAEEMEPTERPDPKRVSCAHETTQELLQWALPSCWLTASCMVLC